MSLQLRDVEIRAKGKVKSVHLQDINIEVEPGQRVALLCPDPTAIPHLLAVLTGGKAPHAGRVRRKGRLSWPIPDLSFCHRHLTFVANARFVARLYEMEQQSFIRQVMETAGLEEMAEQVMETCPKGAISRFAFALAMCVPFDMYLFTSTTVSEKSEQERFQQMVADIASRHGLMLATSKAKAAEPYCDRAFLIDGRTTHYYDDMDAAVDHLARLVKGKHPEDLDDGDSETEEGERVFDDF